MNMDATVLMPIYANAQIAREEISASLFEQLSPTERNNRSFIAPNS